MEKEKLQQLLDITLDSHKCLQLCLTRERNLNKTLVQTLKESKQLAEDRQGTIEDRITEILDMEKKIISLEERVRELLQPVI